MRLRFSIRDLLWLTLAVALVAGWWVDCRRLGVDVAPLLITEAGSHFRERNAQGEWVEAR